MFKKLAIGAAVAAPLGYYYYTTNILPKANKVLPSGADALKLLEGKFPSRNFLYIQHVGSYGKVDDTFRIVSGDLKDFSKKLGNAQFAAFFYDNPSSMPASSNLRGVVGVLYDKSNKGAAQEWIKQHSEYDFKELPEVTTLSAKAPAALGLNASSWVSTMLFPKIKEYFSSKNLRGLEQAPLIEVYDVENDKIKCIEFHVPYGAHVDSLWLTKAPEYKPHK